MALRSQLEPPVPAGDSFEVSMMRKRPVSRDVADRGLPPLPGSDRPCDRDDLLGLDGFVCSQKQGNHEGHEGFFQNAFQSRLGVLRVFVVTAGCQSGRGDRRAPSGGSDSAGAARRSRSACAAVVGTRPPRPAL